MILRFEANTPVEVALLYPEGRNVEGQYGDQVLFSLTDDRKMYVPPIVADRIKALGVRPRENFTITKKQTGRKVEWQVERTLEDQLQRSVEQRRGPQVVEPPPTAPPPAEFEQQGKAASPDSNLMTAALMTAIDATIAAEAYARSKGQPLKFAEANIQALASTIYIQHSKGAVTTWRQ